jgi:hypothetical protein
MILPPLGSWLFISLVAYLVQSTEAVTLMLITDRNFSIGRSSIGVSGREIPAFCKDDVGFQFGVGSLWVGRGLTLKSMSTRPMKEGTAIWIEA